MDMFNWRKIIQHLQSYPFYLGLISQELVPAFSMASVSCVLGAEIIVLRLLGKGKAAKTHILVGNCSGGAFVCHVNISQRESWVRHLVWFIINLAWTKLQ